MNSLKQWIVISLMAGTWVVQGNAQEPMEGPGESRPGPGMRGGRMRGGPDDAGLQDILRDPETVQALKLDEGQTEKIKTLTTQFKKEMIDWNAKLQHATLALVDLMEQAEPSEDAVLKALDETGLLRNEIAKLRVKHLFAVRHILTAEQRQKAKDLMRDKIREHGKSGDAKGGKGIGHEGRPRTPPGEMEAPGGE